MTQTYLRTVLQHYVLTPGTENGRIELSLHYVSARGTLVVTVVRCVRLRGMDVNGYSNPYIKCYLLPDPRARTKQKSVVKKKNLHPEFNHQFRQENADKKKLCTSFVLIYVRIYFRTPSTKLQISVLIFTQMRVNGGSVRKFVHAKIRTNKGMPTRLILWTVALLPSPCFIQRSH